MSARVANPQRARKELMRRMSILESQGAIVSLRLNPAILINATNYQQVKEFEKAHPELFLREDLLDIPPTLSRMDSMSRQIILLRLRLTSHYSLYWMAYRIMDGPSTITYVGNTVVNLLTTSWVSDPTAKYTLRWGGAYACPAAIGKLSVQVLFNGVSIAGPNQMQSPTDCWCPFGNSYASDCTNQGTNNVNTLTVTAQVVGTTGNLAKCKEGFLEFEQYG